MASESEWSRAFARQARADFATLEQVQSAAIPECHKLQFLQMACEKLVKAHLCASGTNPQSVQTSHAYVAKTLPVVLRQRAARIRYTKGRIRELSRYANQLSAEIELLSPAVDRDGARPDNCEYPWEDAAGRLHLPLEWSFSPSLLLGSPMGRSVLKLIAGSIDDLLR